MKLIKSQDDLLPFIPNVLKSVAGERSLFDKLTEPLTLAEAWLTVTFTSEATLTRIASYAADNPLRHAAAGAVVAEAFRLAVPSLDLVLTPNGFGIVSNANIAPASKERVARLLASLVEIRDNALNSLLHLLPEAHAWLGTPQCAYFCGTLFPTIDLPRLCGETSDLWTKYADLRERVLHIETRLAYEFLSPELLAELREGRHPDLGGKVRSLVLSLHFGAKLEWSLYADLLNDIRSNYLEFLSWHNSETAKRFLHPAVFENKKENKGYWF